jgi:hypothetical protein
LNSTRLPFEQFNAEATLELQIDSSDSEQILVGWEGGGGCEVSLKQLVVDECYSGDVAVRAGKDVGAGWRAKFYSVEAVAECI